MADSSTIANRVGALRSMFGNTQQTPVQQTASPNYSIGVPDQYKEQYYTGRQEVDPGLWADVYALPQAGNTDPLTVYDYLPWSNPTDTSSNITPFSNAEDLYTQLYGTFKTPGESGLFTGGFQSTGAIPFGNSDIMAAQSALADFTKDPEHARILEMLKGASPADQPRIADEMGYNYSLYEPYLRNNLTSPIANITNANDYLLRALSTPVLSVDPSGNFSSLGNFIQYVAPSQLVTDKNGNTLASDAYDKANQARSWAVDYGDAANALKLINDPTYGVGFYDPNTASDWATSDIYSGSGLDSTHWKKQEPGIISKTLGSVFDKLGPLKYALPLVPGVGSILAPLSLAAGLESGNMGAVVSGALGLPGVGNALTGALGQTLSSAGVPAALTPTLTGALVGGSANALSGGDFLQGALSGAASPAVTALAQTAVPSLTPTQSSGIGKLATSLYGYSQDKNASKQLARLPYIIKALTAGGA